jgi:hypothetical protein
MIEAALDVVAFMVGAFTFDDADTVVEKTEAAFAVVAFMVGALTFEDAVTTVAEIVLDPDKAP